MSGSLNRAMLIGNVCRDPEIRTLGSGERVANLRIATNETWRDKASGEKKERAEYHAVTVFNDNLVKVIEAYVRKGNSLYIEGQIQTRKWTDQQGVEKYSTEIVLRPFNGQLTMLGGREGVGAGSPETVSGQQGGNASTFDPDSEIPF